MIRCLLLCLLFLAPYSYATPKIIWFSTLQEDLSDKSGFWITVHDLVVAAAEDLDVDLQILYAEENFIKMKAQVDHILSNPALRPDGIIFHNYKLLGKSILERAEVTGVKSIIFNSGFSDNNSTLKPRQQFKHWIGQILPDDQFAGAELLRQLKAAALQIATKHPIQAIAMEGNQTSRAYMARKKGFEQALQNDSDLSFAQYVPADWSRDTARKQFGVIVKRYPGTRIMWAANDNMALGLIDGARQSDMIPGKDFVVGGVDWLPEGLDQISAGAMNVSIGGHFVEGMWALILMYDYLNGFDFAPNHGNSIKTRMLALNKQALSQYGNVTQKLNKTNLSKVDFKTFTRTHNSELSHYQFDIAKLIEKL